MRLMLGTQERPSLLVNVEEGYDRRHFDFRVGNGAWAGTFYKGYITVHSCPSGDFSSLEKMEILTDNQDRLRSPDWYGEYNEVFANFNNPNYVSPYREKYVDPRWAEDDDIPF